MNKIHIPVTGAVLALDCGMTIFVYRSEIDGATVVEIETNTESDGDFAVVHNPPEMVPFLRVMVNEAVVHEPE